MLKSRHMFCDLVYRVHCGRQTSTNGGEGPCAEPKASWSAKRRQVRSAPGDERRSLIPIGEHGLRLFSARRIATVLGDQKMPAYDRSSPPHLRPWGARPLVVPWPVEGALLRRAVWVRVPPMAVGDAQQMRARCKCSSPLEPRSWVRDPSLCHGLRKELSWESRAGSSPAHGG